MTSRERDGHPDEERLHLHAEGALEGADAVELEAHLRSCGPCRRTVEELRSLLEIASGLPRGIPPGRDLWAGIEARIRAGTARSSAPDPGVLGLPRDRTRDGGGTRAPTRRRAALWLAAAASVLIAVTAAATLWLAGGGPGADGSAGPVAIPSAAGGGDPAVRAGLGIESGYRSSVERLAGVLERRSDRLPPETREALEHNLRIIDRAIRQAERALAENPSSPGAVRALDRSYERKIDLLRRSARLTAQL